ncbi:uncharacterized protein [Chelonus insularis]|uniref:uncharacterized protein n=1 Tax=Chelonus insularis TaxID=460826 RepID=UPI00158ADCD4|nr:uncharacterized protein LOC118071238 [Chelonus insularis]
MEFEDTSTYLIEEQVDKIDSLKLHLDQDDLILVHLNVRSLNANFERLELFVDRLYVKPDVIICTETWVFQINRADGVVIYVKDCLTQSAIIETIGSIKFLTVTLKVNNNKPFKISDVYRCHDINIKDFIPTFKLFLNGHCQTSSHIVVGDFNINLIKSDVLVDKFINNFLDTVYIQYFNGETRPNDSESSCIDNFFVKSSHKNFKSYTLTHICTDHFPLFLVIKLHKDFKSNNDQIPIDYNLMGKISRKFNWSDVLHMQDPDCATNVLIQNLADIIDQFRCKRERSIRVSKPRKSWITPGLIKSCQTKETLYRLWNKSRLNSSLKKEYMRYCKVLSKLIKLAKVLFDKNNVIINCNDSKKLWKCINSKIGKDNCKDSSIDYVLTENGIIFENSGIANSFVNFFTNIGINLANKIVMPNEDCPTKLVNHNNSSIFLKPTSSFEIEKVIAGLKVKSGGVDGIGCKVLKLLAKNISTVLENIFNSCISIGCWPKALKTAEIIPVYKSGDRHQLTNYRPISLISNVAKVFEKIVCIRLSDFLGDNHVISDKQFGFMKERGTSDALAFASEYIYKNVDVGRPTILTS